MGKNIIVAFLSTIISSFILGLIFYGSGLSESILVNALFFLIFTAPAYILGGIPVSILLDKFIKARWILPIAYVISGFVVGMMMFLVFGLLTRTSFNFNQYDMEEALSFGICGALGALLFYLVMLPFVLFTNPRV